MSVLSKEPDLANRGALIVLTLLALSSESMGERLAIERESFVAQYHIDYGVLPTVWLAEVKVAKRGLNE